MQEAAELAIVFSMPLEYKITTSIYLSEDLVLLLRKIVLTFEILCLVATFLFTFLIVNIFLRAAYQISKGEYHIINLFLTAVKHRAGVSLIIFTSSVFWPSQECF